MIKTFELILWISLLTKCINCVFNYSALNDGPTDSLDMWFNKINYEYKILSHYTEFYKWQINVNLQTNLQNDFNKLMEHMSDWKQEKCFESKNYLDQMTKSQQRMIFMLCRGPNYSKADLIDMNNMLRKIKESFRKLHVCVPEDFDMCTNLTKKWDSSKIILSQQIDFPKLVSLMNTGAIRNGYRDIGVCWREQLEIYGLDEIADHLWSTVKPFYQLLHAVLRNSLLKQYSGKSNISNNGPLPAHFLGTPSSTNWEVYLDMLLPFKTVNINANFVKKNWTNIDMVKRSEDYYASLGLRRMTSNFWKNSNFSSTECNFENSDKFANMFDGHDYRLNLCADHSLNGFYKIIQQMGYIEYNMLFNDQPSLFQCPTNLAFGEAIGNTIFLGIVTPQHLNRLTLLPDKSLYPNKIPNKIDNSKLSYKFHETLIPKSTPKNGTDIHSDFSLQIIPIDNFKNSDDMQVPLNDFDISLLLRMALTKIPKISFQYVMDKLRWEVLSNNMNFTRVNYYFWQLIHQEQGIFPLNIQNQPNNVDHTAEYHIIQNIPYVPYFLSSFLEVQIFKGLCEYTIFGKFNTGKKILMPLHRCDIYGSKRAGRLLRKSMSLGSSVHWSEVLYILTGKSEISSDALLEYYEPLIMWLEKIIIKNDIPLGW